MAVRIIRTVDWDGAAEGDGEWRGFLLFFQPPAGRGTSGISKFETRP
jgi:hypothetical protein